MIDKYLMATVREVIRETSDAHTLVFEKPSDSFHYESGQFLTLLFSIGGQQVRRSYSLCTCSITDRYPAVTVKRVNGGLVSNHICDNIKAGDKIEIQAPAGVFILKKAVHKKALFLAGGSGITPIMAMLREALHRNLFETIELVYANRNEQSIIFKEGLSDLALKYPTQLRITHLISEPAQAQAFSGLPTVSMMKEVYVHLGIAKDSDVFTCGPTPFMDAAIEAAIAFGISSEYIHRESFVSLAPPVNAAAVPQGDGVGDVTIKYMGSTYKFNVPETKSILQAAMDANIDLPFSCQSGLCTACMGKCTSGKVHMEGGDGLSKKEIEKGFVLTCVGHPVSPNVVIEID